MPEKIVAPLRQGGVLRGNGVETVLGGSVRGVRAIYKPFNGFKPWQRHQKLANRHAEPFLEMVAAQFQIRVFFSPANISADREWRYP
jgi:hypothetical protein